MMPPSDPLANVPPPGKRRLALRVTPAALRAVRQGHPWVFDKAIAGQREDGQAGDLAVIFDDRRRFAAIGLYDPTSPLRVRVLHQGAATAIDRAWLRDRLAAAASWRAGLSESGTTGYRLVHGENDGLPGLVIDRYDATLVLKLYTAAWIPWLSELRAALEAACPSSCVVLRLSRDLMGRPDRLFGLADGAVLAGPVPAGPVLFRENGLRFGADVLRGQKTGFFLDQRDNRERVERLAAALDGDTSVLNVFSYTGGFSLYAARGGAHAVFSLDAAAPALAAAERNFALNADVPAVAAARHTTIEGDAFAALAGMGREGRRFDLVIADPPAFTRRADEAGVALQAYGRLTGLALGVLAPGGILVIASCSAQVSAQSFFEAVNGAADRAGRPLSEFDRTGHAIDHPVRFPEGAYLKCLYATA